MNKLSIIGSINISIDIAENIANNDKIHFSSKAIIYKPNWNHYQTNGKQQTNRTNKQSHIFLL